MVNIDFFKSEFSKLINTHLVNISNMIGCLFTGNIGFFKFGISLEMGESLLNSILINDS